MSSTLISEDLIRKIAECANENYSVEIKTFKVENAVDSGENFCSDINRISVNLVLHDEFENRISSQNFIIKSSISVGEFDKLNEEVLYFPKEIQIYKIILPAAEKLLRSIGDQTSFAPR